MRAFTLCLVIGLAGLTLAKNAEVETAINRAAAAIEEELKAAVTAGARSRSSAYKKTTTE